MFDIFKRRKLPVTESVKQVAELLSLAETAVRNGDSRSALEVYSRVIRQQPGHAVAHYKRANLLRESGQLEAALTDYDRAIELDPNYANAYCNRGVTLERLGRLEAAQESYVRTIALNPGDALALYNRGSVLRELKRPAEALASYEQAIAVNPAYAEAYCNRGLLLSALKCWDAALASYDRCIEINPAFYLAYFNRGDFHVHNRNWDSALVNYDQAIKANASHAESHCNRGVVLAKLRRLDAAMASYDRAIVLKPDFAQAYSNRAALFSIAKQDEAALADCSRALSIDPKSADTLQKRGQVLLQMKRFEEAIADFQNALAAEPESQFLLGTIRHAKMTICDWSEIDSDLQRLTSAIDADAAVSSPMPMLALVDSPQLHLKAAQIFAREQFPRGQSLGPFLPPESCEKIRIGYFSADFHIHPVAVLMAEAFELHDHSKFEIIAFSFDRGAPDDMRKRLEKVFTRFIDVRGSSDREIALLARSLNIDIAVDLGGYTADCRPGIFALRAAPIQINYLGYPGTLGVEHMDYVVADQTVIPPIQQKHFSEKIVYLPYSFLPNDSTRIVAGTKYSRAEMNLPPTGFVYCCFNNSYKILPAVFDSWMRILRGVAGSVLWLSQSNPSAVKNLRREAAERGVDPSRVVFAERMPSWPDHLARHRVADLFLDTRPYNAHATAVDALWAGLPVLTYLADSFAGRVAASLLNALDLPELITSSSEEYEATAIELAADSGRLESIKKKLAHNRDAKPLFDTHVFIRNLESAYLLIQQRYRAGLAPEHIIVPAIG
jgi:protein O-GlcNAc transferase